MEPQKIFQSAITWMILNCLTSLVTGPKASIPTTVMTTLKELFNGSLGLEQILPYLFTPEAPSANVTEDSLSKESLRSWFTTLSPVLLVVGLAACYFFYKVFRRRQEETKPRIQVNVNINVNVNVNVQLQSIPAWNRNPVVNVRNEVITH